MFRKQGLFTFHLACLENLFWEIKTVLHGFVTTFFECEMSILYKEYISELKIVESKIRVDKQDLRGENFFAVFGLLERCHLMIAIPLY